MTIPGIGLPHTNNGLEGIFADVKTKLSVHGGLSKENRTKLIDEYLCRRTDVESLILSPVFRAAVR